MLTGAAMVLALGAARAQTAAPAELGTDSDLVEALSFEGQAFEGSDFDGGEFDAQLFEDEVFDAQAPRFSLAIGRSPTQAGFALDIGGGLPHGWALLTLQRDGAPSDSSLVALDEHGAARVLERNYGFDATVRATCTIPREWGASAGSAPTLTATIPPSGQMPQGPQFLVGTASIVITEIMKDPSFVTDSAGEWFEVFNLTSQPINVDGWKIKDAGTNTHTIHNTAGVWIPQRSYFVFGLNATMTTNGGIPINYKYPTSFSLGNGADDIQLIDAAGVLVDAVSYDDGVFWPDDAGKSINLNRALVDPVANDDGANWCSALTPATPSNTDLATPRRANNTCP